ncbi:MAG: hypothetical protein HC831_27410 [Chloroflexia bacterium]|nr:hypothetical protein [Chloroflexia bacterium]
MNEQVTCILGYAKEELLQQTIESLEESGNVSRIIVLAPENVEVENSKVIKLNGGLGITKTWKALVDKIDTSLLLSIPKKRPLN